MNTEEKFTEVMDKLKKLTIEVVKEAATDLHCDWLPYVTEDTEQNVNTRSEEVLSSILRGNFIVNGNCIEVMSSGITCRIRVETEGFWTTVLDNIVKAMPECPKDLKIKNLESRINTLENDLLRRY